MRNDGNKALAALLTVVLPGAGHLYLGDRRGGVALLCVSVSVLAGIAVSVAGPAAFRSTVTAVLLLVPYAMLAVPAARAVGTGTTETPGNQSRGYLLVMLAVAGPMALPLLWQSSAFSRTGKIAWTVVVVAIVLIAVYAIIVAGPIIEEMMQQAQP